MDFITHIIDEKLPGSEYHDYAKQIVLHGGVEKVADNFIAMVRPEIRELEGKAFTQERLDQIRLCQTEGWPQSGGYINAVTDDRCIEYLRLYASLHYFILWLGNGHRDANFVLLWSAPPEVIWDHWLAACFNLLEALFCRAFQFHHGCLLPEDENKSRLGWGLNVVSPLMQGPILSEMQKLKQAGRIPLSEDPQISAWNSFRAAKRSRAAATSWVPWVRQDYEDALKNAIGPIEFQALQSTVEQAPRIPNLTPESESSRDLPVLGSLNASVAFVLGPGWHDAMHEPDLPKDSSPVPPSMLKHSGFNDRNVLVWTHDLHASCAMVILMCGSYAEEAIMRSRKTLRVHKLDLKGYSYRLFLDNPKGGKIIKFAGLITKMDQPLTPYFLQNSTALRFIFRQRALEEQVIERYEKGWQDKLAEQQGQSEVIALSEEGHSFGQAEGHGLLDAISPSNEERKFLSEVDKLRRNKKVLDETIPSDEVIELVKRQAECETLDEDIEDDDGIEVCSTQEPPLAPTAQTNEALEKKAYPVKPGFKKFRPPSPKSWREEGSVFRGKLYPHTVSPFCAKGNLRMICIWQLRLTFPGEFDIGDNGAVYVSIEMCAEHLTHPDRWAQAATEEDVCRCLSFRITGRDSKGSPFVHIPKSGGVLDVFRANTFVDLVLHKKSDFELAGTPRRYLFLREGCPKELERFINGGYTSPSF
ncbi:hypothetical protein DL765_000121 [Monosporascus sp. GIB2]|nr:hypothetical protein DL765_000121 [Monosporascus sp. GIB2]